MKNTSKCTRKICLEMKKNIYIPKIKKKKVKQENERTNRRKLVIPLCECEHV